MLALANRSHTDRQMHRIGEERQRLMHQYFYAKERGLSLDRHCLHCPVFYHSYTLQDYVENKFHSKKVSHCLQSHRARASESHKHLIAQMYDLLEYTEVDLHKQQPYVHPY